MRSSNSSGALLRKLSSALLRLTDFELDKLKDSSYEIEIKVVRKKSKDDLHGKSKSDLSDVIEKLTSFPSREKASEFLQDSFKSKRLLETIARDLDIPIIKEDKADTLREKIVESTTGARLRSEAIKGSG
ncbi:hypothetical protein ACM792_27085 [Metapseudomonas otitidis]|uniref:hypothetical protein n=1 Tax=Metapseudomonas otitidis TaxID=319939 RepID=UPI0039FCE2BA